MAKLSLAEQISQLANPKPQDDDIENLETREEGSDEENDSDLATEHYVKVGKSKLRSDVPVLNPKYKAGTVSRKALYDNDDEDESGDGADGFIDDEAEESDEEDEEDEDDEDEDMEDDEEVEQDDEDDDEDDEEVADEMAEEEAGSSDEELSENENDSSARSALKDLLRQEQKAAKKQATATTVSDAQKGFVIQHQTDLYETLLDCRMTYQKAMQAANTLPISEDKAEEFSEPDSSILQDTKSKLSDLISQIAKVRYGMAVQDKVFAADKVKLSSKRTFDATLENMDKLDAEFKTYETSVLTKWSQKVQASSASSALNSSKFKALNQSSANQVSATLADMDRLVKRTRMNRNKVEILGEEKEMGDIQSKEGENYYVFDDSDFYRNLLKDLVDRRMVDSGNQNSSGVKWTATKAKVKRTMDTKASKGRRLRYHVQDKVQNFAAPRPVFTWEDDQIDELFAGLFGQKVNFNEDEEVEQGEEQKTVKAAAVEEVIIPDDGLRIFG